MQAERAPRDFSAEENGSVDLWRELEQRMRMPVRRCYGCRKCSGGCPLGDVFDHPPHQIVRLVQLGRPEFLRGSTALQLCIGCGTCGQRCPNGISAGEVINALRRRFGETGEAGLLHHGFMWQLRHGGRINELTLAGRYVVQTHGYLRRAGLGLRLLRHGKLRLRPPAAGRQARKEMAALLNVGGGRQT